jgi:uncharacterized protein (DUF362 family)/Pyruvate/2-oxoacid:ferredoxin oxidoreductase delta subunit
MKTPVAIVRCPSYDSAALDRAVAEATELAGLPEVRGKSILLKPNILMASLPEKAISTRGEVLAAFARLLRSRGAARIMAGESPGIHSSASAAQKSGIAAACEASGVEWIDFADSEEFDCPRGKRVKRFSLASALKEADILVSLPKLKTHRLMHYTGAIKNLFGLVPGLSKSAFHLRFPASDDFGSMLVDLALVARPAFCLMDAVVAMEGEGPANGRPVSTGLLLASRDPLALDWIAATLIGYDPFELPYLADAASRGEWISGPGDIEVRGLAVAEAKPARFELVPPSADRKFVTDHLPAPIRRLVRDSMIARPFFDDRKCARCGACVKICPPGALRFVPDARASSAGRGYSQRVRIDYRKCIRCYCCHEVCPEDAIRLVKRPF